MSETGIQPVSLESLELFTAAGRPKMFHELKEEIFNRTLARNNGDKKLTAKQLGVSLRTIYNNADPAIQPIETSGGEPTGGETTGLSDSKEGVPLLS